MWVAVSQERLIACKLFLADSEPQYALNYCKFQYLDVFSKLSDINQPLIFLIFPNLCFTKNALCLTTPTILTLPALIIKIFYFFLQGTHLKNDLFSNGEWYKSFLNIIPFKTQLHYLWGIASNITRLILSFIMVTEFSMVKCILWYAELSFIQIEKNFHQFLLLLSPCFAIV